MMRIVWLLTLPVLCLPSALAAQPNGDQTADARSQAAKLSLDGANYATQGNCAQAVADFEPALALYRKLADWSAEADTLVKLGECELSLKHPEKGDEYLRQAADLAGAHGAFAAQIVPLEDRAVSLFQRGAYSEAAAGIEEILAFREKAGIPEGGKDDQRVLLFALAHLGDTGKTIALGEKLIRLCTNDGDEACLQQVHRLIGAIDADLGDAKAALPHLKAVVDYCDAHQPDGCDAPLRHSLCGAMVNSGQFKEALPYLEKTLPLCRESKDALCEADVLAGMGVSYNQTEDYARAVPVLEQAVDAFRALNQKQFLPTQLGNLAMARERSGDMEGALDAAEQAYALDPEGSANSLALLLGDMTQKLATLRQTAQFEPVRKVAARLLALYEKVLPPSSLQLIPALMNAADFGSSASVVEPRYLQALEIARANHTVEGSLFVAHTMGALAQLYTGTGDLAKAESFAEQAQSLVKTIKDSPEMDKFEYKQLLGETDNNCAIVYQVRHDPRRALELLFDTKSLLDGTDSSALAIAYAQIAALYMMEVHNEAEARPWVVQAMEIQSKVTGPDHPNMGILHGYMGRIDSAQGKVAEAETEFHQSLRILQGSLGPEHPETIKAMGNFALFYTEQKQFAKAEALLKSTIAVSEKVNGRNHPDTGLAYCNLVVAEAGQGHVSDAIQAAARCEEIEDSNLPVIFAGGTEEQKRTYLQSVVGDTFSAVSLHAFYAEKDPAAAELALSTILRRKGLALDSESDQIVTVRARMKPEDRGLLDRLLKVRSRIAALDNQKIEASVDVAPAEPDPAPNADPNVIQLRRLTPSEIRIRDRNDLDEEADSLQRQIGALSPAAADWMERVSIAGVQAALPKASALIEIYAYLPIAFASNDVKAWRYAVYVVRAEGAPEYFDLGEKEAVDNLVVRFRNALGGRPKDQPRGLLVPAQGDADSLARELGNRILAPIEARLKGESHLLVSPDGELNLLPFGALRDAQGEFAVRRYDITYLSSGRDLLRLAKQPPLRGQPLIIAGPNYDRAAKTLTPLAKETASRAANCGSMTWPPLAGASEEGREVSEILNLSPGQLIEGEKATKSAVLAVKGPAILHIATHGYFCKDDPDKSGKPQQETEADPLTKSGLVFAGANQPDAADGNSSLLTALEASSLDLWGTQLIVLSACDTAVGQVQNGEGIFGLRRALVLAGSSSQVLSLWHVDDAATRHLMAEYYRRLMAGQGRSEALRMAQLALLNDPEKNWQHPYYWAAFIPSGDWTPIPSAVWSKQ